MLDKFKGKRSREDKKEIKMFLINLNPEDLVLMIELKKKNKTKVRRDNSKNSRMNTTS